MIKRLILLILTLCLMLPFTGCALGTDNKEEDASKIDALYLVDYFTGYRFFEDGTIIYYEANHYKNKNENGTGCRPEYWYGTYTLDGASLTIVLSGVDRSITGVYTDTNVVIDGKACELRTTPFYEASDHPSWKELDKALGLIN